MPTILELFKSKELNFPGGSTADGLVDSAAEENKGGFKQQVKNFVDQELNGVRKKSLVEINNPLIYGNEAVRIATRSTSDKDKMFDNRGAEGGGGLGVGKALAAARDAVNSALGIPETLLPSRVIDRKEIKNLKSNDAVTKKAYGKNGTELGKLLKNSGGNPSTLGKQVVGNAIGAAKDGLRGALFGKAPKLKDATKEFKGKRQFFDEGKGINKSSAFTLNGENTYSKYINKESNDDEIKKLMGIGLDGKATDGKEKNTIKYSEGGESESLDKKVPILIWISDIDGKNKTRFRGTISGLSETTSPSWSNSKFMGNPYNYYTYDGVERSISFNLSLYCMNSNDLISQWQKVRYLTSKMYPTITNEDKNPGEREGMVNAPFIRFQIGDLYKDRVGYIDSLTTTMPDTGTWETDTDGLNVPKFIDVAISIKFVEAPGSEKWLYDITAESKDLTPYQKEDAKTYSADPVK